MLVSEELSSSGSGRFSYNNPDYENVERSSNNNNRKGDSRSGVSRSGSAASQFESMFGMARRFPSIRLKGSAKKEAKRAATLQGEWLIKLSCGRKLMTLITCLRNFSIRR